MMAAGNLFDAVATAAEEQIEPMVETASMRIERIVSHGQASPPGFWYDQDWAEWVSVLTGSARLRFEDEAQPRTLKPGDHLRIPPHTRHRVEWTDPQQPTIWLAVHYRDGAASS
jgi:cupin 2 domain-containing protein